MREDSQNVVCGSGTLSSCVDKLTVEAIGVWVRLAGRSLGNGIGCGLYSGEERGIVDEAGILLLLSCQPKKKWRHCELTPL